MTTVECTDHEKDVLLRILEREGTVGTTHLIASVIDEMSDDDEDASAFFKKYAADLRELAGPLD
jgi:hypothetical protein